MPHWTVGCAGQVVHTMGAGGGRAGSAALVGTGVVAAPPVEAAGELEHPAQTVTNRPIPNQVAIRRCRPRDVIGCERSSGSSATGGVRPPLLGRPPPAPPLVRPVPCLARTRPVPGPEVRE